MSENTMYFQDATGGIMVNDLDNDTSTYVIGDAISNIRGHLESVSGVLQLYTNRGALGDS